MQNRAAFMAADLLESAAFYRCKRNVLTIRKKASFVKYSFLREAGDGDNRGKGDSFPSPVPTKKLSRLNQPAQFEVKYERTKTLILLFFGSLPPSCHSGNAAGAWEAFSV